MAVSSFRSRKQEREGIIQILHAVAYAIHRAINNRAKWMKKERKGKREKGRRFKGKYSQTPREATPAELLADIAGGLLTSRAINIFIRRFLSASKPNLCPAPHVQPPSETHRYFSATRNSFLPSAKWISVLLVSIHEESEWESERESEIAFWSKVKSSWKWKNISFIICEGISNFSNTSICLFINMKPVLGSVKTRIIFFFRSLNIHLFYFKGRNKVQSKRTILITRCLPDRMSLVLDTLAENSTGR